METGPWLKVSFNRLVKPVIAPVSLGWGVVWDWTLNCHKWLSAIIDDNLLEEAECNGTITLDYNQTLTTVSEIELWLSG